MRISDHLVGMLSLGGFLRDDLDYAEGISLHEQVKQELFGVVVSALTHPELEAARAEARETRMIEQQTETMF